MLKTLFLINLFNFQKRVCVCVGGGGMLKHPSPSPSAGNVQILFIHTKSDVCYMHL